MLRSAASIEEIEQTERAIGFRVPDDYREFLQQSNGAEGFIAPHAYLVLWSICELVELNDAYSISEFAPGLFLVGTDGSNTGYGFVVGSGRVCYVRVPLVGLSREAAEPMGDSLANVMTLIRAACGS